MGGAARHRRRGATLEDAILASTWDELQAVGYPALSMDAVATRAGTSKPVLYRRWRNRAELVLAALRRERPMLSGDAPGTGSLRGDVIALLERVSGGVEAIGLATILGLLADLHDSPELAAYVHARDAGRAAMTAILERAAARGEIAPVRVPDRVASLPVDLARHELLVTRAPVPPEVIAEIVDQAFLPLLGAGNRPGAGGAAKE